MENNRYPFVNVPLPYAYDGLEPYIDTNTVQIHHERYLEGYINKLNGILKDYPELQTLTLEQLIQNIHSLPEGLQTPIRNSAGGVYNHRVYFYGLQPPTKEQPENRLIDFIQAQYGSFEAFKAVFVKEALAVFGSGYTWLVYNNGKLEVVNTPNQNCPLEQNKCPIFNLDVWEHAYILKHYNKRDEYIADWFEVVNWDKANENFLACVR